MANKDVSIRNNRNDNALSLAPEFEDMVERFFGPRFGSLLSDWSTMSPRTAGNIQENDQCYVLTTEMPGIPQQDIEINVSGNLLTVRAEHKASEGSKDNSRGYRRQYRSFQQSYSLPSTVDADKIEAHYENGILEVMLPKTEKAQPKKIEVQAGKGGFIDRLMGHQQTSDPQKTQSKH